MEHLIDKLKKNRDSDIYPYHMPGHKRRSFGDLNQELCGIDITEIDDFDNLHQPTGILEQLQKHAAGLYGAEESFYLVNGSTSGVLSAISAALPQGGHILVARNCHKSAYHGIYLRNLKVSYLYPPVLTGYDIFDTISPEQIQIALETEPEIGAVLVVSPTYEGRIADIRRIAEIVHERNIPLIMDEAHGAHLGITEEGPENSCQAGADLVIHSVHKTLPALTQAALLHVNGSRIDRERLRRFLRIYQTSSPSYILMASIDNALRFIEQEGSEIFSKFAENYGNMLEDLKTCKQLRILPWEKGRQDLGKLVISVKDTKMTGRELYDTLLHRYGLQLEMAAESYALAMFTVNDGLEAYERMTLALLEIDHELDQRKGSQASLASQQDPMSFPKPVSKIPLAKAWDMEMEEVELAESAGNYIGEFISLYPPGVPVLVPGEEITKELCVKIQGWIGSGLTVQGVEKRKGRIYIKILKHSQKGEHHG